MEGTPPPADRARRAAGWWTWAGLAIGGIGFVIALLATWVQFLTQPGVTLLDAYRAAPAWQPWMPIGILLLVAGVTLAAGVGLLGTLLRVNLARTLLAVVPVLAAGAWWSTALGLGPWGPLRLGFEQPVATAIALVAPALALAALALGGEPPPPPTAPRLRRIARPGRPPGDGPEPEG